MTTFPTFTRENLSFPTFASEELTKASVFTGNHGYFQRLGLPGNDGKPAFLPPAMRLYSLRMARTAATSCVEP